MSCTKESPTQDEFYAFDNFQINFYPKYVRGLSPSPSYTIFCEYYNDKFIEIFFSESFLKYLGTYEKTNKNMGVIRYLDYENKYEFYLKFTSKKRGQYQYYIDDQLRDMGRFEIICLNTD
ncbi:MAG: hypothetical protein N2Z72_06070 [Bacteroidales bacterium]|nr:hypothetical protein [Bacteroidales bacterium]